jgi:hypothetical protein
METWTRSQNSRELHLGRNCRNILTGTETQNNRDLKDASGPGVQYYSFEHKGIYNPSYLETPFPDRFTRAVTSKNRTDGTVLEHMYMYVNSSS